MRDISEEDKPKILQDLLNQRYQAEHHMRQRSADFTKWILGLGVGLLWIILSQTQLTMTQKILTTIFVIFLTGGTIYFLSEICKGFLTNRRIIIRIETLLGFYKSDVYHQDQIILPAEYEKSNDQRVPSHFKSLYTLLIIICLFLVIVIFSNPVEKNDSIDRKPVPSSTTILQ